MEIIGPDSILAVVGLEFRGQISATIADPPVTFSKTAGPDFFMVDSNGVYHGKAGPGDADSVHNVTVSATDASNTTVTTSFPVIVSKATFDFDLALPRVVYPGESIDHDIRLHSYRAPVTFYPIELPESLEVSESGTILGSVSETGDYDIVVAGQDASGELITKTGTLVVRDANALVAYFPGTPEIRVSAGDEFSITPTIVFGQAPYTFTRNEETVPWALSLDSTTGELSGTVDTSGPISITVRDSLGAETSAKAWIDVIPRQALNCIVPDIEVTREAPQVPYGLFLLGTGGTKPYTAYTKVIGPAGIDINSETGEITGEYTLPSPVEPRSDVLIASVTDTAGTVAQGRGNINFLNLPFTLSYGDDPVSLTGSSDVTVSPIIVGGTGSNAFSIFAEPPQVNVAISGTGVLTFSPPFPNNYLGRMVVQARDTDGNTVQTPVILSGNPVRVSCTAPSFNATIGQTTTNLIVAGNTFGDYTIAKTQGDDAITVSSEGIITVAEDIPAGNNQYWTTITRDFDGTTNSCTGTVVGVTEVAGALRANFIGITNLSGPIGSDESIAILISGGTPGYTVTTDTDFVSVSGSILSWTYPTSTAPVTVTVTVTDSADIPNSVTGTFTLTSTEPVTALACETPDLIGVTNGAITIFTSATGGTAPYTYALTGTNPSWLNINSSTGALSGPYPSSVGSGTYEVTVTDANGASDTCTGNWQVTTGVPALSIACEDINAGWNEAVEMDVTVTGGTAPYTISVGSGYTVETTSNFRVFKVKGTSQSADGLQTYSVSAFDSSPLQQNAACSGAITVAITPISCDDVTVPSVYRSSRNAILLQATGGTGSYVYSAGTGSNLISVQADGNIIFSGSATDGTFTRTVTVTDANDSTNTTTCDVSFVVTYVQPRLVQYPASPFDSAPQSQSGNGGVLARKFAGEIKATGGSGGWVHTGSAGDEITGFTIDSSTGYFSWNDISEDEDTTFTINALSNSNESLSRVFHVIGRSTFGQPGLDPIRCLAGVDRPISWPYSRYTLLSENREIEDIGRVTVPSPNIGFNFKNRAITDIGKTYGYYAYTGGPLFEDRIYAYFEYTVFPAFTFSSDYFTVKKGETLNIPVSLFTASNSNVTITAEPSPRPIASVPVTVSGTTISVSPSATTTETEISIFVRASHSTQGDLYAPKRIQEFAYSDENYYRESLYTVSIGVSITP